MIWGLFFLLFGGFFLLLFLFFLFSLLLWATWGSGALPGSSCLLVVALLAASLGAAASPLDHGAVSSSRSLHLGLFGGALGLSGPSSLLGSYFIAHGGRCVAVREG